MTQRTEVTRPEILDALGTRPDPEVGRRFGVSAYTCRKIRKRNDIPAYVRGKTYTETEVRQLLKSAYWIGRDYMEADPKEMSQRIRDARAAFGNGIDWDDAFFTGVRGDPFTEREVK